jgi:hypothetical protein
VASAQHDQGPRRPPCAVRGRVRTRALACLVLAVSAGCALADEPRLVTTPPAGARAVTHIDAIDDYRTAVAAIAAVFERDLGFARFPVTFRFYPTFTAFEGALVEIGYDPAFAKTTARTMTAVGGHRSVLLNESAVARMDWPQRTLLLAHELTHSLQYELGGGRRGTSDQWLREGFAEWVSFRVLDRLDATPMETFRRRKQTDLRRIGRAQVPSLGEMVTFRQWVELGLDRGPAAYALGFLAVELLIEQHGVEAVLDYFSRFATSQDRLANFRAAFGQDLETFERALVERLGSS